MKRMMMITTLAFSLASFAGLASAQDFQGGTMTGGNLREWRQEQRIRAAWKRGALTPTEYRQLQAGERRIRAFEARANSDGKFTPAERMQLVRMERHESRMIDRFSHNERV